MTQQIVVVLAFVPALALVRHVALVRWRDGRLSSIWASALIAALWGVWPFFAAAAWGPWSVITVLFASVLLFGSVLLASYWFLSHFMQGRAR